MEQDSTARKIFVTNKTPKAIWLNRGSWVSGLINSQEDKELVLDNDWETTVYTKEGGKDLELAKVATPFGCRLTVNGYNDFSVRPS